MKENEMLVLAAVKQPEVFAVSWKQFNDEKKHWIENPDTFMKLGGIYGFDWYDIEKNIPLDELNRRETGDTIVWDGDEGRFRVGRRARDIYYPLIVTDCRAYLGHSQIIERKVRTKIELDMITYGAEIFDRDDHSVVIAESAPRYLLIGEVWFDKGLVDGDVCSAIIAKNGEPLSKDCLIERDGMCAASKGKDTQPHGVDVWPLKVGDRISLWAIPYKGGPYELKVAHTQNFLTVVKLC